MDYEKAMRAAKVLARQGRGLVFPNPIVGAVILSPDGEVLAEGFHAGGDHAEVAALKAATFIPAGSTMVVTLEPCNHEGKTGPCTKAIIEAGIARVVYAVNDPNPEAAGGSEELHKSGIEVISGLLRDECAFENRDWLTKISKSRPRFIWKIASTMDGKICAADGTSQWITSESSRTNVALMRSQADAILVGTGTVLADNPELTSKGRGLNPVRIVMGMREIPSSYKVRNNQSETIFIKSHEISDLLITVNERGFNRVIVECGSSLGSALMRERIIDEVVLFQSPTFFGTGTSFLADIGVATITERRNFDIHEVELIGPDIKTTLLTRIEEN